MVRLTIAPIHSLQLGQLLVAGLLSSQGIYSEGSKNEGVTKLHNYTVIINPDISELIYVWTENISLT